MSHYSIDLGIHPEATGGKSGTHEDDAYPLQIGLTQGTLVQENGRYTGFTPDALASFGQIKVGDIIIFRVFDTRRIFPAIGSRSLQSVGQLKVAFTDLNGGEPPEKPWQGDGNFPISRFDDQRSLAFTSVPGGMDLPCYFQRYNSQEQGIVTYTVSSTDNPVPYLFSVHVEATIAATPNDTWTAWFGDDPEMVISPDERPVYGEEERALNQFAEIAATSR